MAIYGPTGIGKTYNSYLICKRVFKEEEILLVRSLEQLDRYNYCLHKVIIFDDINFEFKKPELLIHLCDRDFDSPVRILRKSITVSKNCLKVFTHNNPNCFQPLLCSYEQLQAITRRLKVVKVETREEVCLTLKMALGIQHL